jgi:phosphatidylserine synthase
LILVLILAALMVSNLDFVSLKHKALTSNSRPFETLAVFIALTAILIIKAKTLLLPLGFVYLLSGPVVTLIRRSRRRRLEASSPSYAAARIEAEGETAKTDDEAVGSSDDR